jgi:NAD(P)-dependent dehydrogenase (short-subunit alcohol dehydrogenase family)
MFDFNQKVVVVTGAAGSLGQAVVGAFHKANGIVCALDYKKGRLDKVFPDLNHSDRMYFFDDVDLTNRERMQELGTQIKDKLGRVDVVVNTVGGFAYGERVDQITERTMQRMLDLNVNSFLNTAHAFVPVMIAKQQGKIVTVGSRSSLKGGAKMGAYAAAKAALLRLTESMASELQEFNIQVNCVLPGTIDTPQNRHEMPNADFSKWVQPDQIARVIMFLSSGAADSITGATIPVYGG